MIADITPIAILINANKFQRKSVEEFRCKRGDQTSI